MLKKQLHKFQQDSLISEVKQIKHEDFRWEKLNIFVANRVNNEKTWARVYFVECTDEVFNGEYQFSVKECEEFQSSLLGKDFFSEKTSLRWNYYLYFVYDGKVLPTSVDKNTIEVDTHYARKRFVPLEELGGFLKLTGYVSQNKELPDPESEWLDILAPQKLSGCLQIDKYSKTISKFIEDGIPIGNIDNIAKVTGEVKSQEKLRLISINQLCTQNYRKESFGDQKCIQFKSFNLIEGENGTGKSSIIDAVELALTGSVKRLTDSNCECEGVSWVNVSTKTHKSMELWSNKDPNIKEREQAWYNTPITKVRSSISEKFGQMNRFSIESVFSLVNSQCRDNDEAIQNSITALCFGDNLTLLQKNWMEYKKRFTEEQIKFEKYLDAMKEDKTSNQNRLKALQARVHERQADIGQLYYDLFGEMPKDVDYKRLEDIYLRFTNEILALTVISDSINYVQLQDLGTQKRDVVATLSKKTDKYKNSQALCQQKRSTYTSNESEIQRITGQASLFSDLLRDVKALIRRLVSSSISEDDIENLLTEQMAFKQSIDYLKNNFKLFWQSFPSREIISIPEIEIKLEVFQKDILKCKENINILSKKEREIEIERSSAEQNMNRIQKLQAELLEYGKIIAMERNLSNCPLCGQPYDDAITLQAKIQELTERCGSSSERQLSSLLEELSNIKIKLSACEKEIVHLNSEENFLKELIEVIKLGEQILIMQNCKQIKDILTLLEGAESKNNQSLSYLDNMQSGIIVLRKSFLNIGIPISSLNYYVETCETSLLKFSQQVQNLTNEQTCLRADIVELDTFILQNADLQETLQSAMQESQQIINVLTAVKTLFSTEIVLTPDTDLLLLKNNLLKLEGVIKVTAENSEIKTIVNKLQELEKDVLRHNKYLERCNIAIIALSELKPLSYYSQRFFDDNLRQIAILFKKLHLPPEFRELKSVDGEIVICRPNSDEIVHINQMSMGQRTSLALAILFQMHIMGKNTPHILLLDEPISNLDDVHIMNMVDMLRELTLNGAQVFITTASDEIARYFAHKFAFMKDEMVYYGLKREIKGETVGKTTVTTKHVPYLVASDE